MFRIVLRNQPDTAATLFRNLTVIAALTACVIGIFPLLTRVGKVPLAGRLSLIVLMAVITPLGAQMIVAPAHWVRPELVFILGALIYTACSFLALVGLRRGVPMLLLALAAALFIANLLGMGTMTGRAIWQLASGPSPMRLVAAVSATAEITYLVALTLCAIAIIKESFNHRSKLLWVLIPVFGLTVAAFFFWAKQTTTDNFAIELYAIFGVQLLSDVAPWAYAFPFCLALASAIAGLLTLDPPMRQFSLGTALVVAAGFAPSTPALMISWLLALTLLSRSKVAYALQP